MNERVELIPISEIRILNPRFRNPKKFSQIVENIKTLGLKKPIRVSRLLDGEEGEKKYDLVCGQGRIEAFIRLGWKEIPAIVEDISKEDRLLMSLIENMARRFPSPMDLIQEINRLKKLNYSNVQIGVKIGISDSTVGGLLKLWNEGEERLLEAAVMGMIPLGVAMDISRADTPDLQRELLVAYQNKQLNQFSIRTVRRLMEHRRLFGKKRGRSGVSAKETKTSAEALVNTYRKEAQKQRSMIRKNRVSESRLVFIKGAFKQLMTDSNFRTLLKAEALMDMPKALYQQCHE